MVKTLLALFFSVFVLVVLLFALSVDDKALVVSSTKFSHQNIEDAQRILARNDPRRFNNGQPQVLSITEKEINLVVGYLANRFAKVGLEIHFDSPFVDIKGTLKLPSNPLGSFVNFKLELVVRGDEMHVTRFESGHLNIPPLIADKITRSLIKKLIGKEDYLLLQAVLQSIEIRKKTLLVNILWDVEVTNRVRDILLSKKERENLLAYHQYLSTIIKQTPENHTVSLTFLFKRLFEFANARSTNEEAIENNRALLITLASYISGQQLAVFIPELISPIEERTITLWRRNDFAKHFLISAALASIGDSSISEAIGLYKEIKDTTQGSGFSFTDLAADMAGTRFGEYAVLSQQNATKLQQFLKNHDSESSYMPSTHGLQEYMNSSTFKSSFNAVGSKAYNDLISQIKQRIRNCEIYRTP